MRHLIDTYIEAAEPRKISPFDDIGLLDLIVKTGIADAIASRLSNLKGNQQAIAETIENNVRSRVTKEKMSDPAFYERMSSLLEEVIADRKARAIAYEEYLCRIAEIVKTIDEGKTSDTPVELDSPGRRAVYNVLKKEDYLQHRSDVIAATLKIDETMRQASPDGWRGVQAKEQVIKSALYDIVQDVQQVEALFAVISAQIEY